MPGPSKKPLTPVPASVVTLPISGRSLIRPPVGIAKIWQDPLALKTKPGVSPRGQAFPMGRGAQTPLGRFRDRPPAGTCRNTHADRRARLRRTMLLPVHPLRSIRRSQGRGVSRQIALHTWQLQTVLLGPTVLCPETSAIRSRRPAASEFASEPHLRSPGGISGPAGHPARGTRASSRGSRILMHIIARGQPSPSICSQTPERPVAARRETPF